MDKILEAINEALRNKDVLMNCYKEKTEVLEIELASVRAENEELKMRIRELELKKDW